MGENGVLSPEDDIALLDLHNHLRSTIATGETPFQPAAKNMKKLSWNTTLASQAKEWADQCKTGNDPNTTYGENVNLRGKAEDVLETRYRLEENVLYFYGEWFHYRLSTENETCYHQRGCGRYTQLAWANTESVGCGYAECPNNALGFGDDKPYQTVFVCRYFPAGNLVGQIPYIIAENDTGVASLCPSNEYAANNASGLCERIKSISEPTAEPSDEPSFSPSIQTSSQPDYNNTNGSIISNNYNDSNFSFLPNIHPSIQPSYRPSIILVNATSHSSHDQNNITPSTFLSQRPSEIPTRVPSLAPNIRPSTKPSLRPSIAFASPSPSSSRPGSSPQLSSMSPSNMATNTTNSHLLANETILQMKNFSLNSSLDSSGTHMKFNSLYASSFGKLNYVTAFSFFLLLS